MRLVTVLLLVASLAACSGPEDPSKEYVYNALGPHMTAISDAGDMTPCFETVGIMKAAEKADRGSTMEFYDGNSRTIPEAGPSFG